MLDGANRPAKKAKKKAPARGPQGLPGPRSSAPKGIPGLHRPNPTQRAAAGRDRPEKGTARTRTDKQVREEQFAQHAGQHLRTAANIAHLLAPKLDVLTSREAIVEAQAKTHKQLHDFEAKHLGGIEGPVQHAADAVGHTLKKPTVGLLELLSRPQRAIAGATDEVVRHHSIGSVLKEYEKGYAGKQHTGMADVLKHLGVENKVVRNVVGTGLDFATDPFTYLTLGFGGVAETAARKAGMQALKAGARAGATEEEALAAGRAAAQGLTDKKGIQIGFRAHVPFTKKGFSVSTSGKTTAKLNSKKIIPGKRLWHDGRSGSDIATSIRKSRAVQKVVPEFAPDFRPEGSSPAAHSGARTGTRLYRAGKHLGVREATAAQHSTNAALAELPRTGRNRFRFTTKVRAKLDTPEGRQTLEETAAAIERAPKEVPDNVALKRGRTDRHQAEIDLKKERRREQGLKVKEAKERGRHQAQTAEVDKLTTRDAFARLSEDAEFPLDARTHGIVEEYKDALKGRSGAQKELSNARKNFRNTHGHLAGNPVRRPVSATPLVGDGRLFTGAEHDLANPRLLHAQLNLKAAKIRYDAADAALRKEAEHHVAVAAERRAARAAGKDAADTTTTTVLEDLGRPGRGRGFAFEKARGDLDHSQARIAELRGKIADLPKGDKFEERLTTPEGLDYERDVRPALEKVTPADIKHGDVAQRVAHILKGLATDETKAGVLDQTVEDYLKHARPEDVEHEVRQQLRAHDTEDVPAQRGGSSTRYAAGKHRVLSGSIKEIHKRTAEGTSDVQFSTHVGDLLGHRVLEGKNRLADAHFTEALAATGKKITPGEHFQWDPATEAVYHRTGSDRLVPASEDHLKALVAGKKQDGDFYVLEKRTIRDAQKQFEPTIKGPDWYRNLMRYYKIGFTKIQPAYHIANFVGDMVLAWQADSHIFRNFPQALSAVRLAKKAEKFERSAAAGRGEDFLATLSKDERDLLDRYREAEKAGALQTGIGTEIRELGSKGDGRIDRFNEARENLPRFITYTSARDEGMTVEQATNWTNKHHIDYGDLTRTEQAIRQFGIPFYTFYARNTRLQVEKLLTRPGKAANFEIGRQDSADAAHESRMFSRVLATYQQAGAPFMLRIPGVPQPILFYGRTPIEQGLSSVSADLPNQLLSRASPVLKIPFEVLIQTDTFTRKGIESADDNTDLLPAPSWAKLLPGPIRDLLHVQQTPVGLVWRGTADWALGEVPFGNLAKSAFTDKGKNRYGEVPAQSVVSGIGFKTGPYSPLQGMDRKETERYLAVKNEMHRLSRLKLTQTPAGARRYRELYIIAGRMRIAYEQKKLGTGTGSAKAAPATTPAPTPTFRPNP